MPKWSDLWQPNGPERYFWLVAGAWAMVVTMGWEALRSPVFPSIGDVLRALPVLWSRDGLGHALAQSFLVNVEALAWSTAISLPLAYASRIPALAPVGLGLSKLRFLSPAVFFLVLLFLTKNPRAVKLWMLVGGQVFFLVTTMIGVVQAIPSAQFDDARTLRMSEWQAMWFVVMRGTLASAVDAVRDNAAIGWSMILMVEGFIRSDGGVGVLLANQEKYFNFAQVYAIAAAIVLVGIAQDLSLAYGKDALLPYAALTQRRSA